MNPEFLTSTAIPARHGFFTRRGGVSQGPWSSLNCSLSGQDDPAHVAENRARVARALGARTLLGLHQVHGADVVTVTAPGTDTPQADAPRADAPHADAPRADAMVTARPGLALGIITADCTPVLFHDPAAQVIGAVHAGWRGALAGVLEATIDAMLALGATRRNIMAAIGPSIRQASYEVTADLHDAVLAQDSRNDRFFIDGRPAHWQFDLAAYCAHRLGNLAQIDILDADTLPDERRFFSHRRRTLAGGGPIGHQVSAIVL